MTIGAAETIYALSSGSPPAAIAVIRISGPAAGAALKGLAGRIPPERRASVAAVRHPASGELLDQALLLWFPGPSTATGEDLAELHLHGGRSVVAAALEALGGIAGLRPAEPGEFTRRAFENGRVDLAEAEGLADLLSAETQSQRRAALILAGGALSRQVERWQRRLLELSAGLEATIDFADEGDVEDDIPETWVLALRGLTDEIASMLRRPPIERLRDGIRVVIAGPPNTGKSSLLNYIAGREAAITSAVAGTTRDLVEAPTAIGGAPFLLIDTAGLRDSEDEVESIGVERARSSLDAADIILWLGEPAHCPDRARAIIVESMRDLTSNPLDQAVDVGVSSRTGEGMDSLISSLIQRGRELLPREGEVAIRQRHRDLLAECLAHLQEAQAAHDILVASEMLRQARVSLDRITGRAGVEDMLDALFGRFCIGK